MIDSNEFDVIEVDGNATITRYRGTDQHVQIPDMLDGMRVVGIAERAFADKRVNTLVFPDGLRRLQMDALEGCNQLKEVSLPGSIEYIGGCLQENCPELKTLVLRGEALSPTCMIAVSCLNGVETLHQYSAAGVEAWLTLEMKAICG